MRSIISPMVPTIAMAAAVGLLLCASCSDQQKPVPIPAGEEPNGNEFIVDTVKLRKDPKGGFFGPKLRDVYLKDEDKPWVFCDAGPGIPTGELVTVFYSDHKSTPESSACKYVLGVMKGEGYWKDGQVVTFDEYMTRARKEQAAR